MQRFVNMSFIHSKKAEMDTFALWPFFRWCWVSRFLKLSRVPFWREIFLYLESSVVRWPLWRALENEKLKSALERNALIMSKLLTSRDKSFPEVVTEKISHVHCVSFVFHLEGMRDPRIRDYSHPFPEQGESCSLCELWEVLQVDTGIEPWRWFLSFKTMSFSTALKDLQLLHSIGVLRKTGKNAILRSDQLYSKITLVVVCTHLVTGTWRVQSQKGSESWLSKADAQWFSYNIVQAHSLVVTSRAVGSVLFLQETRMNIGLYLL